DYIGNECIKHRTLKILKLQLKDSSMNETNFVLEELNKINDLPHSDVVSKQYQIITYTIPELILTVNHLKVFNDKNVKKHFSIIDSISKDNIHVFDDNIKKEINDVKNILNN
ncbi:7273_t:CDS:2, partial [Cetraspora pellucida]